jgi:hypothetical protein
VYDLLETTAHTYVSLLGQEERITVPFWDTISLFPKITVHLMDRNNRELLREEITRLETFDNEILKTTHDSIEMSYSKPLTTPSK